MENRGPKALNRRHFRGAISLLFILSTLGWAGGCSSSSVEQPSAQFDSQRHGQYENEVAMIQKWEEEVEKGPVDKVKFDVLQYLNKNPHPHHWYSLTFILGRSYEGLGDWENAIASYKAILSRTSDRQMDIVAMALYRLSYCYEAQNNSEQTLASLLDALKHKNYLPLEISTAEIPARIASVHARLNQIELADRYTKLAEKGILRLKATKRKSNPSWMSRTLLAMGTVSVMELTAESFDPAIRTLKRNQKYLLQVVELNASPWKEKAEERMIISYQRLWDFIDNYQLPTTSDVALDVVKLARIKSELMGQLLESIQVLKGYQAPVDSPAFVKTADIFLSVKGIEAQALARLEEEMLKRPPEERQRRSTASVSDSATESAKGLPAKTEGRIDPTTNQKTMEEEWISAESSQNLLPRKLPKKKVK